MTEETALTWSWLNVLTKARYEVLREVYGDLEQALCHLSPELLRSLGCREDTALGALVRREEFQISSYREELRRRDVRFLSIDDGIYPSLLREIPDAPVFLYAKGDTSLLSAPCIGMVGTRAMTPYGKSVTQAFVPTIVRAGVITVSGLAEGIDGEVARETIAASGKTVAVLGHGLSMIYPPSHRRLAEEIVKGGGLLLSEYPLDTTPTAYTFPARNRIIAGLSLGTVVLEAPKESGSLITAKLALDYGREVFAVPGPIFEETFQGCHALIAKGEARITSSPEEVLKECRIVTPEGGESSSYVPKSPDEERLLTILSSMPQPMDAIVEKSGLEPPKASAALTMMELAGAARNIGNGQWVKA